MKVKLGFVQGVEPKEEVFNNVEAVKTIDQWGYKRLNVFVEREHARENNCLNYSTPLYLVDYLEVTKE